ncbi:hypothetical protein LTR78_009854 [Recurvomyces mirabilis]|uniref:Uncharacterized protein n=1 Tax=Recurvomyces mirabilis TaxID=574656 RepID=A0AAE0WIC1_9PEZI|nr:hypothetical protein LTR78_009854 [Recurvomyces mirabilis]KAK5153090.1 hypothetical protein LTS14_007734 [Recurvomyces mirabilis]
MAGAQCFSIESDGKIVFDASQGFRVTMDILELAPSECVERIHAWVPLGEGSLASMSDLVLLRAVTVADRGSDGDILDFNWLLSRVVEMGYPFPEVDDGELEWLCMAVEVCFGGVVGRLVLAAVLGSNNAAGVRHLLSSV